MNFDYIIVGGGSAGCILADKLSSSGKHTVLLIEAGGSDASLWYKVPIGYAKSYYDSKVNWMFYSEPEAQLNNRSVYCPRGKILGGSGAINAMIYVRGFKNDFADWASNGNPLWSYDHVLPFFKQLETHASGETEYHGGSGPIKITQMKDGAHPICNQYLAACNEIGLPLNDDFNGETPLGAGIYDINVNNGYRSSSNYEFLAKARNRSNLSIKLNTIVNKVNFNGKQAVGVNITSMGKIEDITANCEVILSAGAVHSPMILQLSGVGPRELLAKHNIDIVHELDAVGKNLQDHICASLYYEANVKTLNDDLNSLWGKAKTALNYLFFKKGLFALSVNQAGGFFKGDTNLSDPNIQLYFNPLSYQIPKDGSNNLKPEPYSGFLLAFNPCRPTSRGTIEISANDPLAKPFIRPNYLTTAHDQNEVLQGTKLMLKIMKSQTMQKITVRQTVPDYPLNTDAEIIDYFKNNSGSIYHLCGTCAMGDNPNTSVVDQYLRVHGVSNLRVIDSSIFPNVTSGNTNASTMMVALRGADMIVNSEKMQ
jgi:choline dehydrogenase